MLLIKISFCLFHFIFANIGVFYEHNLVIIARKNKLYFNETHFQESTLMKLLNSQAT